MHSLKIIDETGMPVRVLAASAVAESGQARRPASRARLPPTGPV
jgi:hypothetical protein